MLNINKCKWCRFRCMLRCCCKYS